MAAGQMLVVRDAISDLRNIYFTNAWHMAKIIGNIGGKILPILHLCPWDCLHMKIV